MQSLARHENFVCTISGLGMFNPSWTIISTEYFVVKTIEIFGIDRCIFGSNEGQALVITHLFLT